MARQRLQRPVEIPGPAIPARKTGPGIDLQPLFAMALLEDRERILGQHRWFGGLGNRPSVGPVEAKLAIWSHLDAKSPHSGHWCPIRGPQPTPSKNPVKRKIKVLDCQNLHRHGEYL
jgi:hypothetical protein